MPSDPIASIRMYAHELAAMAKTGLEYAQNDYDRDRFERTLRIASELAGMTLDGGIPVDRSFLADDGVVTPKTGSSVAAFDHGRILLIRRADNGRWALPGGYAEINSSPAENALRELREETGFTGEVERFLGLFDNRRFGSTALYQFYVALFRVRIVGGEATPSLETTAVEFFAADGLPEDMSEFQRVMCRQAFAAPAEPAWQ